MTSVTLPIYSNAMPAPDHAQNTVLHQSVSQNDVQRFEQALVNPQIAQTSLQAEQVAGSAVGKAIASFETMEKKNKAIVSKLTSPGTEVTTSTLLEFDVALEESNISYSFAKQLISAPSQWIKELTSLQ